MKKAQQELDEIYENNPDLKPQDPAQVKQQAQTQEIDPLDAEEKFHDIEQITSISVFDSEIAVMDEKMSTAHESDRDFFKDKKESLEFAKEGISDQVQSGFLSMESYFERLEPFR